MDVYGFYIADKEYGIPITCVPHMVTLYKRYNVDKELVLNWFSESNMKRIDGLKVLMANVLFDSESEQMVTLDVAQAEVKTVDIELYTKVIMLLNSTGITIELLVNELVDPLVKSISGLSDEFGMESPIDIKDNGKSSELTNNVQLVILYFIKYLVELGIIGIESEEISNETE